MDQRCGRCKESKDQAEFSPSYRGKAGTWCRSCFAAYKRGRSVATPHAAQECTICGGTFVPKSIKSRSSGVCSSKCKEEGRRRSGQTRAGHLRRKYGITLDDYDRMLSEQDGGCAICGVGPAEQSAKYRTYLHVDHCHVTGRVRGLLCGEHNLLIGRFNDDPALLRRVADYLDKPG